MAAKLSAWKKMVEQRDSSQTLAHARRTMIMLQELPIKNAYLLQSSIAKECYAHVFTGASLHLQI